jgi:hypothetical protein
MSGINGRPVDGGHANDRTATGDTDMLAAELRRLESEIALEEARIEAARARQAEANASLRQVVTSLRSRLAEMERQHEQRVEAVRAAAAAEAEDVVEAARRQADDLLRRHAGEESTP